MFLEGMFHQAASPQPSFRRSCTRSASPKYSALVAQFGRSNCVAITKSLFLEENAETLTPNVEEIPPHAVLKERAVAGHGYVSTSRGIAFALTLLRY